VSQGRKASLAALLTDAASYLKWLGPNCPVVLFSGVMFDEEVRRVGWKKESEEERNGAGPLNTVPLFASDSQASLGSTDALCLFGTRTPQEA
jgi:hypothetical protein